MCRCDSVLCMSVVCESFYCLIFFPNIYLPILSAAIDVLFTAKLGGILSGENHANYVIVSQTF
jgi:hypothetical protein